MNNVKLALVLLLTATVTADAKTACRTSPDLSSAPQWAWRMIDGRTCWYPGERRRDKSLLYWTRESGVESAVRNSPAGETEPPISIPDVAVSLEPEPTTDQLRSYSPEDEKLLTSYWPDLPTLLAERSPTHVEMFDHAPPPSRWRDHDMITILILALFVVSGLVWGLEVLRTKLDGRRTQ